MSYPAATTASPTGLARITLHTPQRRVDVALPEQVTVVDLLPDLLRHAGVGLADDGEQHGGWVLRRADGNPLTETMSLQQQSVRDGEILHLVPAQEQWPELEYDDVVEAIAEGARRRGTVWTPAATRMATLVGAGVLLVAGVLALVHGGPQWTPGGYLALTVAVLLLVGGVLASRAYGDGVTGSALAGFALPYAFAGGALVLGGADGVGAPGLPGWLGEAQLLVGCVAVLLFAVLGAAGVGHGLRVFTAGGTAGLLGALTALLAGLGAAGAAAVLVSALVCGIGLVPVLAIRFGKVPVPSVTPPRPADGESAFATVPTARNAADLPDRSRVFAAVARSEELLTGMLIGYAVLMAAAGFILVTSGGTAGRVLVAVCATALLLRSRLFVTVRQRVPLVAAGLFGHLLLLGAAVWLSEGSGRAFFAVGTVVLALVIVLAGQTWSRKAPSPYVGRAADLFDLLVVVSVVPVAAWVLGVYGLIQGWAA
ncbi:type VII secretion integral membrane protein EccD [Catellatospora vulcania]|uniref:type VII secretion integral membrane protein EccD n=1 Tax=Catellatospora vulcania TaxID=1460450 RepID=UPI0012D48A0A|nr:type VII secretion integral membrane protein EccD [Catellatospora vulcania]